MKNYSLIANSGVHILTFPLELSTKGKYKLWFHEWYNTDKGQWCLDPVYELRTDDICAYYNKTQLYNAGYLTPSTTSIEVEDLSSDGIKPLKVDDEMCEGINGEIFSTSFQDRDSLLSLFENIWLPIPYFFKRTAKKFKFGPLNWSRFKLVPKSTTNGVNQYDVLLAIDTRAKYSSDEYNECPVFPDNFRTEMDFELCNNQFYLMDFCASGENWSYIDQYIFSIVHPDLQRVSQIKGSKKHKMTYIAFYTMLLDYLAQNELFPTLKLYKDTDVEIQDVDMVVDIGNSKTTALLIEDNSNFNQVRMLELVDYTDILDRSKDESSIRRHAEPFDMRLAFRKLKFGTFGISDSHQFIYPSLVRLGKEAKELVHKATNCEDDGLELLSTYSSPKRYLWDWKSNKEEWKFLVLKGEEDEHILNIKGITNQLKSDGTIDKNGNGGQSFHYSRRSLMTFSFLEMLVQAKTQINSCDYRSNKTGFGRSSVPRKVKRVIITCPTAMSKEERNALIQCANDAVTLLDNFNNSDTENTDIKPSIEVIPTVSKQSDAEEPWFYDEATCAQLVYMYSEVGHKYKGCCNEFFNLYGKIEEGDKQPSLTVASLDIGAGTSDLMISKYTYEKKELTTIAPEPKFYDSFYFAGDDMLKALIKSVMLFDEEVSAFRAALKDLSIREYRQKIKDFFGPDYNGQTLSDRILRKDFNIQYSVPLMYYFLELLSKNSEDCIVRYADVFENCEPNQRVIDGFKKHLGIDVTTLEWHYSKEKISQVITTEFEPLLKKLATIIYSYACDIVLLSGRPASLSVIRDLFLKYYSVSPNRLIVLNNYFVGDWYPFSQNTGYITNPKTIVATGGLIGHYAYELSNLNKFVISLDKIKGKLQSTVNYIERSHNGKTIDYFITPEESRGEISVSTIPKNLKVRQIGLESYPSRSLYSIDFNRYKMMNSIRKRNILEGGDILSDAKVASLMNEKVDKLKKKMPFTVTLERDSENKEDLSIIAIEDKEGNEILDSNLEIHIQSLGVDDKYWLDSGAFDF